MNTDLNELLNEEQKAEVAEAYKNKIIAAINGVNVASVRKMILKDIQESFENEMFLEHMDGAAIGKAITAKIKEAI